MLNIPVLRWGEPYESLEVDEIKHFYTGEPIAKVSQANGGIVKRDMNKAWKCRDILRQFPISDLIAKLKLAADLYENGTLPMGDGTQSPEDFVKQQSSTTGLPESLCKGNITKNSFVLRNMDKIMDCLTRGLDLNILTKGWGMEHRNVIVSYQCQAPVLGAVLPSNSPGVHTLWLPVIPLQVGLALKPGSQEPWTVYRIVSAFTQAGIPKEVFGVYPGGHDAGGALLEALDRAMIFGSAQTVEKYKGNPRVQAHGPGFSKVILGDDEVDNWEQHIDMMAESIATNSGRGCINASGVWASRHTEEIAAALAAKLGPIEVKPPQDPEAKLAAFTVPGQGKGVWSMIEQDLKESGVKDMTSQYGERLIEKELCSYLRPVIAHSSSPDTAIVKKEYMFPFASVVKCPEDQFLKKMGYTLVCTAITKNEKLIGQLSDATFIDRLNIGPIPTTRLNWLQPHEGSIIDFLYRSRAYQVAGV